MRWITLLLALALGGCSLGDDDQSEPNVSRTTTTKVEVIRGIEGGFDPRAIYERESPGVVTVIALFGSGALGSLLDRDDRGDSGLGSGFVIDGGGEIVTNAHVVTQGQGDSIRRAREVYVEFGNGNRVPAKIVGHDPNADVALLKIDPAGLEMRPLPLGRSKTVQVGQPVVAMGSPFGEEQSLSVGVVSAIDRDIRSLTDFRISGAVQTDAAINPGNSGGPLVNAKGEVIGVNQQISTTSGGGEGVGFAVPIDAVKHSVDLLRDDGRAEYAYIGVASQSVYPQLARRFGLPVKRGAWLQEVTEGGPADRAGLKGGSGRDQEFQAGAFRTGGEVVVRIGDVPVEDSGDLADSIARLKPGDQVEVEYYRGREKRTTRVRLGERPLQARRSGG